MITQITFEIDKHKLEISYERDMGSMFFIITKDDSAEFIGSIGFGNIKDFQQWIISDVEDYEISPKRLYIIKNRTTLKFLNGKRYSYIKLNKKFIENLKWFLNQDFN